MFVHRCSFSLFNNQKVEAAQMANKGLMDKNKSGIYIQWSIIKRKRNDFSL